MKIIKTIIILSVMSFFGGVFHPNFANAAIVNENPKLLGNNVADPAALYYNGKYYAYKTGHGFNVFESSDGVSYTHKGEAVRNFPARVGGLHWAPDVVWDGGQFVMVFSAQDNYNQYKSMCIWRATSKSPLGPFNVSSSPFQCSNGYGDIDPSLVRNDSNGAWYLLYREGDEGRRCGLYSTWINQYHQTTGKSLLLAGNCGAGPANDYYKENPEMIRAPDGTWVLFFSRGNYKDGSYKTGWATCSSPSGPCQERGNFLKSGTTKGASQDGPGGLSVAKTGNKYYALWHGYVNGNRSPSQRKLFGSALKWRNGHTPYLEGSGAWVTSATTHIENATHSNWMSPTDNKKHNEAIKVTRTITNGEGLGWLHNISVSGGNMNVDTSVHIDMMWLNKDKKVVKAKTVCDYTARGQKKCSDGARYANWERNSGIGDIKKNNGQKIINNVGSYYTPNNLAIVIYICQRVSWSASSYKDAQTGGARKWTDGLATTDWNCAKIVENKIDMTTSIKNINTKKHTYDVEVDVKNTPFIKEVLVPTWTEYRGQDDLKWYQMKKISGSGNKYRLTVKASDHKNETGKYNTHVYVRQTDGSQKVITLSVDKLGTWTTEGKTFIRTEKSSYTKPTSSPSSKINTSITAKAGEPIGWISDIKVSGGDMTVPTSVHVEMLWLDKNSKKIKYNNNVCDWTGTSDKCAEGVWYGPSSRGIRKNYRGGDIKKKNGQYIVKGLSAWYKTNSSQIGQTICQRVSWSASNANDSETGSGWNRSWLDGNSPTGWNCAKIIK